MGRTASSTPLAVFRFLFGLLMFAGMLRFALLGWIDKLYIQPEFHFSYYGFEWVKPLGEWTYVIFGICGISALAVAMGYRYRLSIITFFISFTYIELMDKTTYLNHYYFISILSFLMIFLPCAANYSLDAYRDRQKRFLKVPGWTIDSLKLLLGIVYFYAGLAKLNSDWLLRAMPLKIWLPARFDMPLLGDLLTQEWVAYAFSYTGAVYDLCVPFLLLYRKTRWLGFLLVVVFHLLTRALFPIGMFPFIMIASTLIFFSVEFHERFALAFAKIFNLDASRFRESSQQGNGRQGDKNIKNRVQYSYQSFSGKMKKSVVLVFFVLQILIPWRYLLYPGELFWTEEGFRFSWRVMLMEKAGYIQYKVVGPDSGKTFYVDNSDFLTAFQEKQMSFQPDFILEYAHYLHDHFESQGHGDVEVYADSWVGLNGRRSQPYVSPDVNLAEVEESFSHKKWLLPFKDTIYGL